MSPKQSFDYKSKELCWNFNIYRGLSQTQTPTLRGAEPNISSNPCGEQEQTLVMDMVSPKLKIPVETLPNLT